MKTVLALIAVAALNAGCVTPMLTPNPVNITAKTPGTVITYLGRQCTAPCTLEMRDKFGNYSTYVVTAKTPDGREAFKAFEETRWIDAQGVIPKAIHFDI